MTLPAWRPGAIYRITLSDEFTLTHAAQSAQAARRVGFDTIRISPVIAHDPRTRKAVTQAQLADFSTRIHALGMKIIVDWEPFTSQEPHADYELADRTPLYAWCAGRLVDGVCVRHVDSLPDQRQYLAEIRAHTSFVMTEKHLTVFPQGERETTPVSWNVSGNNSYAFICAVDGMLTHPDGFYRFEALRQFLAANGASETSHSDLNTLGTHLRRNPTSVTGLLTQIETAAKREVASEYMSGDMEALATLTRDAWNHLDSETTEAIGTDPTTTVSDDQLAELFAALAAALPVARADIEPNPKIQAGFLTSFSGRGTGDFFSRGTTGEIPSLSSGALHITRALSRVRSTARAAVASNELLAYLGILLTNPDNPVALRFARTTSRVLARGVTGRAHYRYCTLAALCEVGGSPAHPRGMSGFARELHLLSVYRKADRTPVVALSSPATRYSAHERGRGLALAEVPDTFIAFLRLAERIAPLSPENARPRAISGSRVKLSGQQTADSVQPNVVDRSFETLLWQSIIVSWGPHLERTDLKERAIDSARMSGRYTSVAHPVAAYEQSIAHAINACYDNAELRASLDHVAGLIAPAGKSNYRVARTFQLLAPSVPEIFDEPSDTDLIDTLIPLALKVRARHTTDMSNEPATLTGRGPESDNVCGFAYPKLAVVGVRLPLTLAQRGGWSNTTVLLPQPSPGQPIPQPSPGQPDADSQDTPVWQDALTNRTYSGWTLSAAEVLATQPVAILECVE